MRDYNLQNYEKKNLTGSTFCQGNEPTDKETLNSFQQALSPILLILLLLLPFFIFIAAKDTECCTTCIKSEGINSHCFLEWTIFLD